MFHSRSTAWPRTRSLAERKKDKLALALMPLYFVAACALAFVSWPTATAIAVVLVTYYITRRS